MTQIRLAPSGPPIENAAGGPLDFGAGARLRLTEGQILMGGSTTIPTTATTTSIVSEDGFGAPAPLNPFVLELLNPKPGLSYRALMRLDVVNLDASNVGSVVLYLDVSVNGGGLWTEVQGQRHDIYPNTYVQGESTLNGNNRQVELSLPLTLGSLLGIVGGLTPTPSILFRVRAQSASASTAELRVQSVDSVAAITGLVGQLQFWVEECF
jgi:hypothetical protein